MKFISGKLFIVSTLSFILVVGVFIWFFYPPVLNVRQENVTKEKSLDAKIAEKTLLNQTIKKIESDSVELDRLYDLAEQALPDTEKSDLLLLQLDGLTKSVGITATITVPFTSGAAATTTPPVAAPEDESEIKAGTSGASSAIPIVTGSDSSFSLSGDFSYAQTKTLLAKLRSFIRWNQLTALDLSVAGDKLTVTVAGKTFWSNNKPAELKTDGKTLIDSAKKLFDSYESYSTEPNIETEGVFGRANPFGL